MNDPVGQVTHRHDKRHTRFRATVVGIQHFFSFHVTRKTKDTHATQKQENKNASRKHKNRRPSGRKIICKNLQILAFQE